MIKDFAGSFRGQIQLVAQVQGIEYDDLLETVLHRTFCFEAELFAKTLVESVANVKEHIAHRKAVAEQRWDGAKYDENLDILGIKAAVASEIKTKEPGVKCSMRTVRHPRSLDIDIKAAPFPLLDGANNLTAQAGELGQRIEEIANQYNYDHGDSWSDYCCNNFFLDVTILDIPVPFKIDKKD